MTLNLKENATFYFGQINKKKRRNKQNTTHAALKTKCILRENMSTYYTIIEKLDIFSQYKQFLKHTTFVCNEIFAKMWYEILKMHNMSSKLNDIPQKLITIKKIFL